ncbi:hypothetical protein [Thalassovita sp.]|uniref:hypothetical protein n=1 Tax=Thalassovita sp. TaxID=1979401 RepID=UPI0029DE6C9D|nr:hypothetical protein [Thalassovita sp.]
MGLQVLVQLGLFLALLFGGIGVLLAGLGLMKWGNGQELKGQAAEAEARKKT